MVGKKKLEGNNTLLRFLFDYTGVPVNICTWPSWLVQVMLPQAPGPMGSRPRGVGVVHPHARGSAAPVRGVHVREEERRRRRCRFDRSVMHAVSVTLTFQLEHYTPLFLREKLKSLFAEHMPRSLYEGLYTD